jgi:sugar/nucleoside kinase (ribokinase family)
MARIFAFGNPVYDDIITPATHTHGRVLSGCSTNVCLALSRLGHEAALVGCVGADLHNRFVDDVGRFGIRAYIQPTAQTGGFRLVYDQLGNRTLDVLGVAGPIAQVPVECAAADAIVIGPILQETPPILLDRIQEQSHARLFLDPQGMLRHFGADGRIEHYLPDAFAQVARRCHVIKANEVEAHVLTGIDPRADGTAAARALRELGCEIAIVTLAEAGSYIDDGHCQFAIPAFATDACDPTGAGDTYMAGFLHAYLTEPDDLYKAGCMGAAVASIWIEQSGPDVPIMPAEVERRLLTLLEQR